MLTTLSLAAFSFLVHTGAIERPTPHADRVELASKLTRATSDAVGDRACSQHWEPDSDAWWSCSVGLATWRCEAQGTCSGGMRVTEAMPLPDPAFAGTVDWDAI